MNILSFIFFISILYLKIIFIQSIGEKGPSNGTRDKGQDYDYDTSAHFDYYEYNDGENDIQLKYQRCFCSGEDIWNGTFCISMSNTQSQNVTSRLTIGSGQAIRLNTTAATITTECLGVEMLLNESDFYFLNDEDIYDIESDLVFGIDSFCIQFIGDHQSVKEIKARVCLPPPVIPICCKIRHKCANSISAVITIGGSSYLVKTDNLHYSKNFQCSIGEIKHKVPLKENSTEISLAVLSGKPHLIWNSPAPLNMPFAISNNKYCIEDKETSNVAHFCYRDPIMDEMRGCKTTTCTRKCCPRNFLYRNNEQKCVETNESIWTPSFVDATTMESIVPTSLLMLYGYPWCSHHGLYQLDGSSESNNHFYLLKDGSLYDPLSSNTFDYSMFCLDRFQEDSQNIKLKALVCFESSPRRTSNHKCEEVHGTLYPMLIVISCAFLFITLVVYASVPELYANLHGKSLLSHVSSLLIAYVCQVIISWSASTLSMFGCKLIALATQISFLWAFFWLNVMCFDIWWTLKSMSPSPESGESSRRRFMLYSVYAWGCPLFIGLVTAVMEFLPQLDATSLLILPGFGVRGCWFQDVKSTWLYFHGFTLLLYMLNIFFFIHVAAILIISQRLTEGILRITRKQYKERVFLYLKLFVVMGITWICEVASWQEGTCEYWMFTDIINSLQGMFLFLIFMCNKKVFQKIHAKMSPVVRHVKSLFKSETTPVNPPTQIISSASQRTTQTSLESSSRRLSSSSLNSPGVEISLRAVGEDTCNPEKNKFY